MQFVGYAISVATLTDGMSVFVPIPGQDPAVPTPNIVRSFFIKLLSRVVNTNNGEESLDLYMNLSFNSKSLSGKYLCLRRTFFF